MCIRDRLSIPTRGGNYLPLAALGSIELENNPTQITRENGQRTLSVYAGAARGFNINQLNANLLKFAESYEFPEGYSYKTGGVNEENEKSVQSILQAMVLSGLLILITMIIEFQSFRQAFLALLIIPVSIAGVFYIFGLTGIPLSFPALIGILALFGIVVTQDVYKRQLESRSLIWREVKNLPSLPANGDVLGPIVTLIVGSSTAIAGKEFG